MPRDAYPLTPSTILFDAAVVSLKQGSPDENLMTTSDDEDAPEDDLGKDVGDLENEERSGTSDNDDEEIASSETDEDEDEGLGDGNMGGRKAYDD